MHREVVWIEGVSPGRLAVSPAPAPDDWLDEAIKHWRDSGVEVVASMLQRREAERLGLMREPEFCLKHGIKFLHFPIVDHSVPDSRRDTCAFALQLSALLNQNQSVLVHCFAGIGRSVTVAACVMALSDSDIESVLERISRARGFPGLPETPEQRQWIFDFAAGLKNKRGP